MTAESRPAGARSNLALWSTRVGRKTLYAVSLWVGVLVGSFLLFQVAPGDPARRILGSDASEEAVQRLRHELGTDRPLSAQFSSRLVELGRFSLGRSVIDGRSVATDVGEKFLVTARLAILSSVISLLVSYLVNFVAYYFRRPWLIGITKLGAAVPTYCTGVLAALLFGVLLPIVPLTGYGTASAGWTALLLPAFVAAAGPTALMAAVLAEKVNAESTEGYARTAKAYGFSPGRIFHQTLLPAVWVSWLTAWVNQLSVLFVASFVLEIIFTIPGTGVLLVRAIQEKDYPILQGVLLWNAAFFIAVSWTSAALFSWLDPRLRTDELATI